MKEYNIQSIHMRPEQFDAIQRDAHLHNVQFPMAKEAYKRLFAIYTHTNNPEILHDWEHGVDARIKSTKQKREFFSQTKEGCCALLGLPKDTEIDVFSLIIFTVDNAFDPNLSNALNKRRVLSQVLEQIDPESASDLIKNMHLVMQNNSHIDASHWNWHDALKVFQSQPELFGISTA